MEVVKSLEVMLFGMCGIFLVMAAISLTIALLNRIFR